MIEYNEDTMEIKLENGDRLIAIKDYPTLDGKDKIKTGDIWFVKFKTEISAFIVKEGAKMNDDKWYANPNEHGMYDNKIIAKCFDKVE